MVDELTDVFTLPTGIAEAMIQHCLEGRPNEACGLLASENGEIVHCYQMTNEAASPVRYQLVKDEYLKVDNDIRSRGWDLGAVYHSHTRTLAYPSPTDVREASEAVPYLIISLENDPPVIRAFRITNTRMGHAEEINEIPVELR